MRLSRLDEISVILYKPRMPPTVALFGTLDTKGPEYAFLRDRIRAAGVQTLVIDASVAGEPAFAPDIGVRELFAAGGADFDGLRAAGDRGAAVTAAADCAAVLARRLFGEGRIQAVAALGGSAGTTIGTAAMRALPVGVPKVMVSTLAAGDTRPYVGLRDVCMMPAVVDIAGLNRISRAVIANAAAAVAGMLNAPPLPADSDRPLVGLTMFGVTTPCVQALRARLEQAGYECLVFHATGTGGRVMESLIDDGFFVGVCDVTTTEWADELVGGILSAGETRLEAAGKRGLPQVVSVGALDMVNFGPMDTVPERFRTRLFHKHNPTVTLMRTTVEENRMLGAILAAKLNDACGPVRVYLPLRGLSALDAEGRPFHNPVARRALYESLEANLDRKVELVKIDGHINDPAFAEAMAAGMLELLPQPK